MGLLSKEHEDEEKIGIATSAPTSTKDWEGDQKELDAGAVDGGDKTHSAEEGVKPVSFIQLFRFSTKVELALDAIGLIAAAASGAAQPLMALLFGNLTQNFVEFSSLSAISQAGGPNDAATADALSAAAEHFREAAARNASYLVYIGLGIFVTTWMSMFIWVWTGEVNARRVREAYLRAVLRQDIAFFDKVAAGEVATRVQMDTHLVQQGISEKVASVANAIGSFFCGFILAYIKQWRLALAMSSMLPCIAITGGVMNKFISGYMQLSLENVASGGTLAEEVISTIRTAHAFGTQKIMVDLYDSQVQKSLVLEMKAAVWHGGGLGVFFFVIYGGYALAFHFGSVLINQGHADAGEITSVIFAVLIGSFALAFIAPEMQAITQSLAAAANLYETIDRVPDIDSASDQGLKPSTVPGEISLKTVTFAYPSRPTVRVVDDLSLMFQAGKTAALVGASGSGKSTIVTLVERFYDPSSGSVTLDGVDLKDLNLKWLRSQIGLVSQEPTLFATTIRENVAYGLINTPYEHASEGEKARMVKEACVKANADGFISGLPEGYETLVGERGFLLSGGQKQRVAIARAIVSDPRILLLDEATSALDTQSEGVVQEALDRAAAGRTTITIAHRLSTIVNADVIYVMGEGRVLESGTHSELVAKEGAYARLVEAQKLRENEAVGSTSTSKEVSREGSASPSELATDEAGKPISEKQTQDGLKSIAQNLDPDVSKEKRNIRVKEGDHSLGYFFKRMGLLVRDQWPRYFVGAIFSSMTGFVYPAFGIVFALGVEGFTKPTPEERQFDGSRNALWFFIIALLSTGAIGGAHYLFAGAAAELTRRLRTLSLEAILRQDVEFFDRDENSTGSLTARISDNPQKVNGMAGVTLGALVQGVATIVAGVIIGLAFSWKIALVCIACIPALVSPGYIRLRVVVLKDQADKKAHEDSAQLACEAAASIRTVAALTMEDNRLQMYSESLKVPLRRSTRVNSWSQALYAISQGMMFFAVGLNFWWGSRLVSRFEVSTFQFFVGLMSTTFGALQAGNAFASVPDISAAKSAGSDIIKLLDAKPQIDAQSDTGRKIQPQEVVGHIKFENVHFRYPTRPAVRVLRNFSLEVQPGTRIALVGASGSGKSTVIQLLERFYDPLSGEIYLDGERITDLNLQSYRKQIALVSQEPTLYAGTVRFNVLLGAIKPMTEVTQEEIETACRDANILEFIQSLPQGFDTEVGGKGSQLSGGQKQRIAIARALLRNPKVLLLDEATSALDSTSEEVVQAALDQASRGRTTIAIAHRLSTIQNADCIFFVKEGCISECGTHDELIAKEGDYYEYVQLQGLGSRHADSKQ